MKYRLLFFLLFFLLFTLGGAAFAQEGEGALARKTGNYLVSLRLPPGGLYAGEEQQIEFRLVDLSRNDPVLGPAAVIRAEIRATISMPAMPSMPRAEEVAHQEGVPGDYGIHPTFAHGGEYLLTLEVKPPAGDQFTVAFPLLVADENKERRARPKPYRLELRTEPKRMKAGESLRLHLKVWADRERRDAEGRPSGKRIQVEVRDFDLMHERLLHLIVVSSDLDFFAHLHPEPQKDGSFLLDGFVLPKAGDYRLFADAAPQGAGGQIMDAWLKVEGKMMAKASAPDPSPERAAERKGDVIAGDIVDGIKVALEDAADLVPRRTLPLRVTLRDSVTGEPVADLEPYLGALGHMLMIDEGASTFVHAHPDAHPDEREPETGRRGELRFLVRPPEAGRYRLWVEFQRQGRVRLARFAIEVREPGNAR